MLFTLVVALSTSNKKVALAFGLLVKFIFYFGICMDVFLLVITF
jgi:hypothetical protein